MHHNRSVAVVVAGALIGGTLVTSQVSGDTTARDAILADLTAISCDVLTQEHDPDSLLRADAMLRAVVRDVAGPVVTTPSAHRRTSDALVLALAVEAHERFGEPSDQIARANAARAEAVIAVLLAGRTGPDTTEEAWFFGPTPDWIVDEGSTFEVALGVCPGVEPGEGTTIDVTAADGDLFDAPAFVVRGNAVDVRTARRPGNEPVSTTVTIVVTTAAGLTSIAEFEVTLRPVADRAAVPAPPPMTTRAPTTTVAATTVPVATTTPSTVPPTTVGTTEAPAPSAPPTVTTTEPPMTTTTTVPSSTTTTSTTEPAATTTTVPSSTTTVPPTSSTTEPPTSSVTTTTTTTTVPPTSSTTEPPTSSTTTTTTTTTSTTTTSTTTTTTSTTTVPPTSSSSTTTVPPDPPAQTPALVALLASARRQFGRRRTGGPPASV